MWGFLGHRVIHSIWVLLAVFVAAFLVIRLIPGDPVVQMLGIQANEESVARVVEAERSISHSFQVFVAAVSEALA